MIFRDEDLNVRNRASFGGLQAAEDPEAALLSGGREKDSESENSDD